MKRLLVLLVLFVILVLPLPGFAQGNPVNPNANISWPPPVYVLRGPFTIRGTANVPNMTHYFVEVQQLNDDLSPHGDVWVPVMLPSQTPVQDGILGVWDTTTIADGIYTLRLTVSVSSGDTVFATVSPIRVQNTPSPFEATPTPVAPPTLVPSIVPTQDSTPRVTIDVPGGGNGNVRAGDSVFYPIVASVPTGTTALILGISNRGTGWYQIQLADGTVGWVAPSIVTTSGDLSNLPKIQPPPPPPPTRTPTPSATPTAASAANLVAGIVQFDPGSPVCGQSFTVGFDVANLGTQPTTISGTVSLVDSRAADGTPQVSSSGGFPVLQPGQTFRVNIPITVSTWFSEQHNITLVIDPANQILESNKGDNVRVVSYTLQKGGCG